MHHLFCIISSFCFAPFNGVNKHAHEHGRNKCVRTIEFTELTCLLASHRTWAIRVKSCSPKMSFHFAFHMNEESTNKGEPEKSAYSTWWIKHSFECVCSNAWTKQSLTSLHFVHRSCFSFPKIKLAVLMRCELVFYVKMRICAFQTGCLCVFELFTILLSHCHLIVECRLCTHYTQLSTHSDKYISFILNTPVNIYNAFGICYVLITDTRCRGRRREVEFIASLCR